MKKPTAMESLQYDANMLFKDQKQLGNRSSKNHTTKISEAVFKAMADNGP